MSTQTICWLCGGTHSVLVKRGNLARAIDASGFRITDADYGKTADIHRCSACGFMFCPTVGDVTAHYRQMDDPVYEDTRDERALQARQLLQTVRPHVQGTRLLDVGAGSGILVEQAKVMNFDAVGIEPSAALSALAAQRGLNVINDVLPQAALINAFDVVTLIDVIEHVDNPRGMMQEISRCLAPGGICAVVTPDVGSLAARAMGQRWWHYRLAHIGYFNVTTLRRLLHGSGFDVIAIHRPSWYFPASYLAQRLMQYLPAFLRVQPPAWLDRITIPLNLFDSLLVICRKRADS
jgi:SAM-dependent methyltransferase